MPLLGNPTAAVLYPGKVIYAALPYAWAARLYAVAHSALAFVGMLVLMRSWGTSWAGSAISGLAYSFGGPVIFQYCNIIFLVGASWIPWGMLAVDRWLRLGRPGGAGGPGGGPGDAGTRGRPGIGVLNRALRGGTQLDWPG